jgi:hypothetical protein
MFRAMNDDRSRQNEIEPIKEVVDSYEAKCGLHFFCVMTCANKIKLKCQFFFNLES